MGYFVKHDTTYLLNGLNGLETGNPFKKQVGFGFRFLTQLLNGLGLSLYLVTREIL